MDFRLRRFAGSNPRLGQFDPAGMFGGGYQGFLYNFQDLTTLFTTPTRTANCALGDAIALVLNQNPNADKCVYFDGANGTYISTPDSAANSVTGDIDIRVKIAMNDWTGTVDAAICSKVTVAGNQVSYYFVPVTGSAGTLRLGWSPDGTAASIISKVSTVAVPATDGQYIWIRATLDVDNGAGGNDVKFYTSTDSTNDPSAVTWTQLGATVTTAGTTSIFNSTASVVCGDNADLSELAGRVKRLAIYNGIAGTKVVDFNPANYTSGSTLVSSTTGETWTLNGTAFIAPTDSAVQHTAASRPVLGCRPKVGKRNRARYSETLTNATYYSTVEAAIALGGGSYDSSPFYEVTETTANSQHAGPNIAISALSLAAGTYNVSTVVKKKGRRYVGFNFGFNASNGAIVEFDLDTATVVYAARIGHISAVANSAITEIETGVFRISTDFTANATYLGGGGLGVNMFDAVVSSPIVGAFVGDVAKGLYATRVQISEGSGLYTYQRTTEWYITTQADSPNVYFAAADGSNDYLTIPGSASSCKWLHDGTGAYVAGVWQAGNVPSPEAAYTLLGSSTGSANTGIRLGYTDAGASENLASLDISNGTSDILALTSAADSFPANTPAILTANYQAATSPNSVMARNGVTIDSDDDSGTPASGNAANDISLFRNPAGSGFLLGTLDYALAINRVPGIAEDGRFRQYLTDLTGVAA